MLGIEQWTWTSFWPSWTLNLVRYRFCTSISRLQWKLCKGNVAEHGVYVARILNLILTSGKSSVRKGIYAPNWKIRDGNELHDKGLKCNLSAQHRNFAQHAQEWVVMGGDMRLSGKIEFGHIWVGEDQRGKKILLTFHHYQSITYQSYFSMEPNSTHHKTRGI